MSPVKGRRKAREVALQALYEVECTGHGLDDVLAERLSERPLDGEGEAFARRIATGVLEHARALDHQIEKLAPEWPLEQMALIDRSILRIALWEFAVARQTPVKVAINEAVELAKEFGSDSAPRFVNGVLGAAAADLAEPAAPL
jgi:N utilization substance protein B